MIDKQLTSVFAALADPMRRTIIERLALGEASAGQLAEPFGISKPAISKHLKVLENANLVAIDTILLSTDSAAGTVGSAHIDNVIIDGGAAAVKPSGKLSTAWGAIKSSF